MKQSFTTYTGPFKRLGVNSSSDDETGSPPLLSLATHKLRVCLEYAGESKERRFFRPFEHCCFRCQDQVGLCVYM